MTWREVPRTQLCHLESDRSAASTPSSALSSGSETLVEVFCPEGLSGCDATACGASSRPDPTQRQAAPFVPWAHPRAEDARVVHLRKNNLPVPVPASTPTAFDPHAVPFVPAAARARAPLDTSPCTIQVKPAWLSMLRRGCVSNDRSARRMRAQTVVAQGQWDAEAMTSLVGKLTDCAVEGHDPELTTVAPFARALYDEFEKTCSKTYAMMFGTHLAQCVWTEFSAWWNAALPTAVVHLKLWPDQAQPLLKSALAIAAFAADLFVQGLVPATYIHRCLLMLTGTPRVIEEVHAVRTMLSHADAKLCANGAMAGFVDSFAGKASMIPDNASVVRQQFDRAAVKQWISEIREIINGWTTDVPSSSPSKTSVSATDEQTPKMNVETTPKAPAPMSPTRTSPPRKTDKT
ncbi:hypothetical protein B0H21DRAFT_819135 [Amylocystis lapponica]|nr:hypothetical protein B0H21DRAFT_819135 [Amylocystis lapponica]